MKEGRQDHPVCFPRRDGCQELVRCGRLARTWGSERARRAGCGRRQIPCGCTLTLRRDPYANEGDKRQHHNGLQTAAVLVAWMFPQC